MIAHIYLTNKRAPLSFCNIDSIFHGALLFKTILTAGESPAAIRMIRTPPPLLLTSPWGTPPPPPRFDPYPPPPPPVQSSAAPQPSTFCPLPHKPPPPPINKNAHAPAAQITPPPLTSRRCRDGRKISPPPSCAGGRPLRPPRWDN
jgi:hypothetical protein